MIELSAVEGLPEISAGDDLAGLIAQRAGLTDGDIVVIAQKVVSKAEGRAIDLASVSPGGCIVESRQGEIDAQIETQVEAVVAQFLDTADRDVTAETAPAAETAPSVETQPVEA